MKYHVWAALASMAGTSAACAQPAAQGWITQADAPAKENPVVLHFRRTISLSDKPVSFPVRVSADNRFILYVNGTRVASGPSTGDVAHWREQSVDLARWLKQGANVVAAVVWNGVKPLNLSPNPTPEQRKAAEGTALFTQTAPNFQQSVATGFRLIGEGAAKRLSTSEAGWRVRRDKGHSFENGWRQVLKGGFFYVAGHPEIIDARLADFNWNGPKETGSGWSDAIPAPDASKRNLVADKLPAQTYAATSAGTVVRSDLVGGLAFPERAVTVPPNRKVKLLIQRDAMISAYPRLDVTGGAGSKITLTWSEALYDAKLKKADRAVVGDRNVFGIHDTFLPDGNARSFETLWWRTWRYAEIAVETKDQPLVLKELRAYETGYPFAQVGRFVSNDPSLTRIFDVGWRTARIDAHETYMDTAYWEQLQYTGDTRLQMLISYAVAGDPRLAEQAIDAYAGSNVENGLMDGAYPQRSSNVIAPFSLVWVGMLDDWMMRQPDQAPVVRHLARMREVLDWFKQWRRPSGLLGKNPQWNFIDWAGQSATDRSRFPSYGSSNESCLMSVSWLGALQQGARIEGALGDQAKAAENHALALELNRAIRARCWVPSRGLFADNPDGTVFSQHMNALAILYDVATPQEAGSILDRIVVPGNGIDAPEGMFTTSYYFAWYLAQATVHAGKGDRYLQLLDTWRDLLKLNYTTWPEERGDTRSDSHAWSAHPTADLLGVVAGIGPATPGYATVRIAPALGPLTQVDATAATPKGPVTVRYRIKGGRLTADVHRPATLQGTFEWKGKSYPLTKKTTRIVVPVRVTEDR
ncbi:alpha-L-rhamnosidase C-terminal domain-containing protein [Novosphingobium sp. P6W]|uniref:alpha-L-rhamnosidase-related protein n=1 Tax=Novosphingobium sp. P6W TaxID=1609758 RepID=UPI0005C2D81F|nr:alpha-L-rhamnosidase C-terminal domain-containing protein [Novosphingobium sp. P6W]AXB80347.1 hypothetical protein TQ38_027655 [Novosphingobium sp. P6W]KIS29946.1 hypothetical protein TQ38_25465 [Novosphingobium sp. P6W]